MTGIETATLLYMAIGTAVVGTAVAAYSSYQQGKAEQAGYDYNAQVATANAETAKTKAYLDENQQRDRLKRLMGTQRTLYAKAGVDLTSGSPLMVLADTASEGEKTALNIRYGGEVSAAEQFNQAQIDRFYGSQASSAGTLKAVSTVLTGLGSTGMGYATYKSGLKTG